MDGALPFDPEAHATRPQRLRLLGGEVDVITSADVLNFTAHRIEHRRSGIVANHNLHSLHLLRRSPQMARFYQLADLIEADSTPLIMWGRLLGRPIRREHRCTYLDWREAFWSRATQTGWRVFYLGGEPGVAAKGADAVRRRWPGVQIATRHGRFDIAGPENAEVLAEISAFAPDVLFVGMGMPRQEAWIVANLDQLPPCVAFSVGAAFDYEAGASATPPRWSGRVGLEWLFRLAAEPRRLARRYLVEPWSLIGPAAADLVSLLRR